jgi:hypothetical protein
MSADRLHSQVGGATKPARRLAFSGPMGVSAVAVLAVAIIAAAILLGPRSPFGLGLAPSPSPMASASHTATAEATLSAPPTVAPTPPAAPTPQPTPIAAWSGLDWVSGTIVLDCDHCRAQLNDVLWWNGQYIGVGSVSHYFEPNPGDLPTVLDAFSAAFFVSSDGVDWSVADQRELIDFQQYEGIEDAGGILETAVPHHLIALPSGVLAIGGDSAKSGTPPGLWRSDNGMAWSSLDSPDWRGVWGLMVTLVEVAGGDSGAVAIGFDGGGCCLSPPGPPVIAFSPDGLNWERVDQAGVSSMDNRSLLTDVLAPRDGFIIVGSAREPDQPRDVDPMPGEVGRPAAWTSTDGRTWVGADVEGSPVTLGRLTQVVAGADGFFAIGIAEERDYRWQTSGWASVDGHTWRLLGEIGVDLPRMRVLASDGERITGLGTTTLYSLDLGGWSSTDGITWTPLTMTGAQWPEGDTEYLNPDGTENGTAGMTAISNAWAVPVGLVVVQPVPPPVGGQWVYMAKGVE